MDTPTFNTKKELFNFLVTNKDLLVAQKKAELKKADAVIFQPEILWTKPDVTKDMSEGDNPNMDEEKDLLVKVVINTTNIIDSHRDCHLNGLWKKSLSENKMLMHLQEHTMKFDHVISDGTELKAYAKSMPWSKLGFTYEGNTEALIFESTIKKERNEFMYEQYKNGYVRNHSVGMRYVQLVMCINDKEYGAEYEAWQKYYPIVVNKEVADEREYFWVVKEAKIIEGSAVLCGSNYATPTLSVSEMNTQPESSTEEKIEPVSETTQKGIDYEFLNKNFNLTI